MNSWANAENHSAVSDTEWRREVGDRGDTNLTNPTWHRLRWSKESETHKPKDEKEEKVRLRCAPATAAKDVCALPGRSHAFYSSVHERGMDRMD